METQTIETLFGAQVIVVSPAPQPATLVEPTPLSIPLATGLTVAAAVGRIVAAPPQSFALVEQCERVAAVRIIPRAVVDPVVPLALCGMPDGHWWAMRRYWVALLSAVRGEMFGRSRAHRAARVVLHTLDSLSANERTFFTAHLWAAFNGEAV